MKGDFSKNTFDKKKQYTSVRMQQGRVQLDSDWNEQMDIIDDRIRIGSMDFVGGSGAPSGKPGYAISVSGADLSIGAGRYYVQGILVDNTNTNVKYTTQTDFPKQTMPTDDGLYLAYLDVWQQVLTANEETGISEPALNGADTTTRLKNIAQVKLVKLTNDTNPTSTTLKCDTVVDGNATNKSNWEQAIAAGTGKLTAKLNQQTKFAIKNQLYRVEIHDGGDQNAATFKWSRDNGALMSAIKTIVGSVITINKVQNEALNFQAADWVELTTQERELRGIPGKFVQLLKVNKDQLTLASALTTADATEFVVKGKVRRWENVKTFVLKSNAASFFAVSNFSATGSTITLNLPSASNTTGFSIGEFVELRKDLTKPGVFVRVKDISGATLTLESGYVFSTTNQPQHIRPAGTAAIAVDNTNDYISLEDGLEIKLTAGTYKTGDYWLLPTRAATKSITSKFDFSNEQSHLPEGVLHYHARLALVRRKTESSVTTWQVAGDCRNIISALGNKALQSSPTAPTNSIYVDKDGNIDINKAAKITGKVYTNSLQVGNILSAGMLLNNWNLGKPLSDMLFDFSACVVNNTIYHLGGNNNNAFQKGIKTYDPFTGASVFKTNMVQTRRLFGATVWFDTNQKAYIYAIGGLQDSSVVSKLVEAYDVTTGALVTPARTLMPTARSSLCVATVGGKIYAIGGVSGSTRYNTVEEYNPATNAWTTTAKKAMPTSRSDCACGVVNGKIYVIGGRGASSDLTTVEQYDPATDTWMVKAPMPTARMNAQAVVINDEIYVIGGKINLSGVIKELTTVEKYHPGTDTWQTLPSLLTPRARGAAVALNNTIYTMGGYTTATTTAFKTVQSAKIAQSIKINNNTKVVNTTEWKNDAKNLASGKYRLMSVTLAGKIYVLGGRGSDGKSVNTVEVYDPVSKVWQSKATLLTKRDSFAASVVNGKIYVFGGWNVTTSNTLLSTVEEYDPITNQWTSKASLSEARANLASVTFNGKIYVMGGHDTSFNYLTTLDEYDPATNTWSRKTAMPTGREGLFCSVVQGKIYAIGGYNGSTSLNVVEVYNPTTNTWSIRTTMPTARHALTTDTINGKIYAIGGKSGSNYLATVEVYDPTTNKWQSKTEMSTARSLLTSSVVDNKIYVIGGYNSQALLTVEVYVNEASAHLLQIDGGVNINKNVNIKGEVRTPALQLGDVQIASTDAIGDWQINKPISDKLSDLNVCVVDGTIYHLGGNKGSSNGSYQKIVKTYDPKTGTVTSKKDMGTKRGFFGSVVWFDTKQNAYIYAIGGQSGSARLNSVEAYDVAANTWTTKTNTMPTARDGLCVALVNGKIYAIGGTNTGGTKIGTVEEYNPATDTWTTTAKKAMPTARTEAICNVVKDKIYVIGGYSSTDCDQTEMYDPLTDTWVTKAPMPTARTSLSSVVVDNKIYVMGGKNGANGNEKNAVEEYDPATDTWRTITPLLTKRSRFAATVLNDTIYLIGGYSSGFLTLVESARVSQGVTVNGDVKVSKTQAPRVFNHQWVSDATNLCVGKANAASVVVNGKIYLLGGRNIEGKSLKAVEVYDPINKTWTSKASMANVRDNFAAAVVNGKIYVIGGWNAAGNGTVLATVEEYNPATDTWANKTSLTVGRTLATASVVNGKIYLIGGYKATNPHKLNTVDEYNPATDTWTTPSKASMPTARYSLTSNVVNGKIYAIGGHTGASPGGYLATVEEYDPVTNTWSTAAKKAMPTARDGITSNVAGGKIYVFGGNDGTKLSDNVEIYDPLTNTWECGAAMPLARRNAASSVIGGQIYVMGGWNKQFSTVVDIYVSEAPDHCLQVEGNIKVDKDIDIKGRMQAAELTTDKATAQSLQLGDVQMTHTCVIDSWQAGRPITDKLSDLNVCVVNGIIYYLGGNGTSYTPTATGYQKTVRTYDPKTGTVVAKNPMAQVRGFFGSVVWFDANQKAYIYAIGGQSGSARLNSVEAYDVTAGTWATKTNTMPTARDGLGTVLVNGKIYAIGGNNSSGTQIGTVEEYDPATDTWSTTARTPMPTARSEATYSVVNNKIYAIGGYSSKDRNEVEEYDPVTDVWSVKAPMPTARTSLSSVVVDNKIYVMGGKNGATGDGKNTVEVYDPAIDTWCTLKTMPTVKARSAATVLDDTIYLIGGFISDYLTTVDTAKLIRAVETPKHKINLNSLFSTSDLTKLSRILGDKQVPIKVLPSKRAQATSAVYNGKIYVFGGTAGGNQLTSVSEYDPASNTWVGKTPMPTGRYGAVSGIVNNKIYVIGGYTGSASNIVQEYNPANNTWAGSNKAAMTTARYQSACATFNNKIYVLGGSSNSNKVEIYTPSNNSWGTGEDMPTGRRGATAAVVNGKIYVMGGHHSVNGNIVAVEEYDPVADTWKTKAPMPTARYILASAVIDGKIYAFGGWNSGVGPMGSVEEYDPVTDTWTVKTPLLQKRDGIAFSEINGTVYLFGGEISSGTYSDFAETFTPGIKIL